MISFLLAVAFTFSATATGVEKGTPLEFFIAQKGTDRDYETMFLLDEPIALICNRLEKAGLLRGKPTDSKNCQMWPVGCTVKITPSVDEYCDIDLPKGARPSPYVYTGGSRNEKGTLLASDTMPSSFVAFYSLAQSPFVLSDIYDQSEVYGCYKAKKTLKKGDKVVFRLDWSPDSMPKCVSVLFNATNFVDQIKNLKTAIGSTDVELRPQFSDDLSVVQATAVAQALSMVDSLHVKINGKDDGLFFRSFLPLVKWTDRKERLVQPFEITINENSEKIIVIDEDWSGPEIDPKLTERASSYDELVRHTKTDTAFFFCERDCKLSRIRASIKRLPQFVANVYVFAK